jgi:uncharacterized membrane protein YecN with MAPEG domain
MYLYPSLVTALTLIVYQVLTVNVGRARMKYKIMPPAMSGDENFERVVRVQQNTLEQLVFFLPALWLFSFYVNPLWGAVLGSVWLIGRIIFAWGYYQAAEKRVAGFAISTLSGMTLVVGALIGIGLKLFNIGVTH